MNTFLRIYPPFLVFMILYVQSVAYIRGPESFNFRELLILSCWIPIFTIPGLFFRKKWFYVTFTTIFFLEGLLNLVHLLIVKVPISASNLFIVLNTNFEEASDFLELKSGFPLLLVIPYLLLFIFALRYKYSHEKINKFLCSVVIILAVVFIVENVLNNRFVRKALPQTTKALVSLGEEMKTYRKLKIRKAKQVNVSLNHTLSRQQVFVLIIGESCNRNHMSLYSYKQLTNPKLSARKDIIVYTDVVSASSNTISSLLSMMSESNYEKQVDFDKAINLIDVFRSLDFRTYWLSNQSPIGIWDNAVFCLAQMADISIFVNNQGNSSFESTYLNSHDEKLFLPLKKILYSDSENKFVVIHLMGSHSKYSKRYPGNYRKFKNHHAEKEKIINDYDNSVLYNDFVVDSLINTLAVFCQKNNAIASSVYIADHGENVYDEGETAGHDYAGILPRANVEVPMIVWLSQTYKTCFKEKYLTIVANRALPFMSDDLFHAILDLGHVRCKHQIPERSVFHEDYNAGRKRVLEHGKEYR